MGNKNGQVSGSGGLSSVGKESLVVGQTSQGVQIHATLLKFTRYLAVFEIYNPGLILRTSEVFSEFKILINDYPAYSGRAVISNLVNTGPILICEATLEDSWVQPDPSADALHGADFTDFLQQWQKVYKIRSDFKVIVADMQSFLSDMRLWLERVELSIRSAPTGDRIAIESETAAKLAQSTTPVLTNFFEKFEDTLNGMEPELVSAHQIFSRRQLHPLLLCSPFLYRTFFKPLGYAGDYEMINMIIRDPFEGGSLYAKIINYWFLQQAPAEAHRNRITYLTQSLTTATLRAANAGRTARILNLGCGPAHEIQRFLKNSHLAERAQFTLIDFNSETLAHTESLLGDLKKSHQRSTEMHFVRKSVNQMLKDAGKTIERPLGEKFDLVYCAGLFDYLTGPVCRRLTNVLYDHVAPGGTLIVTNVDNSNPRRVTMDYVMEWHLIYRNATELNALKPDSAAPESCSVKADETGVNIYFEASKPARA